MDEIERLRRARPDVPALRPDVRAAHKEALLSMIDDESTSAWEPDAHDDMATPPVVAMEEARRRRRAPKLLVAAAAMLATLIAVGGIRWVADDAPDETLEVAAGVAAAPATNDNVRIAYGAESPSPPEVLVYEGESAYGGTLQPVTWCSTIETANPDDVSLRAEGTGTPTPLDAPEHELVVLSAWGFSWVGHVGEDACDWQGDVPPGSAYSDRGDVIGSDYDSVAPQWPGGLAGPIGPALPEDVAVGQIWSYEIEAISSVVVTSYEKAISSEETAADAWTCDATLESAGGAEFVITTDCAVGTQYFDSVTLDGEMDGPVRSDDPSLDTTICAIAPMTANERFIVDSQTGVVRRYEATVSGGASECPDDEASPGLPPMQASSTVLELSSRQPLEQFIAQRDEIDADAPSFCTVLVEQALSGGDPLVYRADAEELVSSFDAVRPHAPEALASTLEEARDALRAAMDLLLAPGESIDDFTATAEVDARLTDMFGAVRDAQIALESWFRAECQGESLPSISDQETFVFTSAAGRFSLELPVDPRYVWVTPDSQLLPGELERQFTPMDNDQAFLGFVLDGADRSADALLDAMETHIEASWEGPYGDVVTADLDLDGSRARDLVVQGDPGSLRIRIVALGDRVVAFGVVGAEADNAETFDLIAASFTHS